MLRVGLSWHGGDAEYDEYERALRRSGDALGIALSIVRLAGRNRPDLSHLLATVHGLCLTGGEDVNPRRYGRSDAIGLCAIDPERDRTEWALLEQMEGRPIPTLAICRGAQLLNVFHGGTLIPDLGERNDVHQAPPEKEHMVNVVSGTTLAGAVGVESGIVNSSHHQAVDHLASNFCVGALARDGTIEAFEALRSTMPFTLAVQWHPELMMPGLPLGDSVFEGFLRAAAR